MLNLNRIYAANPNAVAMQAYAAGIVYNALRAAQSEVSAAGAIEPEELSNGNGGCTAAMAERTSTSAVLRTGGAVPHCLCCCGNGVTNIVASVASAPPDAAGSLWLAFTVLANSCNYLNGDEAAQHVDQLAAFLGARLKQQQ